MSHTYQQMDLWTFCTDVRDRLENRASPHFVFFLGAGCSISSGIPGASDLARVWLSKLISDRSSRNPHFDETARWLDTHLKGALQDPGAHYSSISGVRFNNDPQRQQVEIERITANRFPAHGYALLAQLIGASRYMARTNYVLTTNFDDLITDALYLYTEQRPQVLVHENLFPFALASDERPTIIKLHGDAHLDPKNQTGQISNQAEPISNVLRGLPPNSAMIVAGYRGLDHSTTQALANLADDQLRGGLYWVNSEVPPAAWSPIWASGKRRCYWVNHLDFDALMIALAVTLDIPTPDLSRAHQLRRNHQDALATLDHRLGRSTSSDAEEILSVLKKRLDLGAANRLRQLSQWLNNELRELPEEQRIQLFVNLAKLPEFHANLHDALQRCSSPGEPPAPERAPSECDIERVALESEHDGDHYIHLAEMRLASGDIDTAKIYLTKAERDHQVHDHPDLIGAQAFLCALSQDETGHKAWELFELALALAPNHRKNLVRFTMVILGTEIDSWIFEAKDIWTLGNRLMNRFFDLPRPDDDALWYSALYCVGACYAVDFRDILEEQKWPASFKKNKERIDLGPERQFLEGIANRVESADPEHELGWAYGTDISPDQFEDSDTLRQFLTDTLPDPKPPSGGNARPLPPR